MRSKAGATCYLPVVSRDETHILGGSPEVITIPILDPLLYSMGR